MMKLAQRQILKDWTQVDDFEVGDNQRRSFCYHVVEEVDSNRTILTIKLYRSDDLTMRLDPTDVAPDADFHAVAERRVRQLYAHGKI